MADDYREKLAKFILEELLGDRFKELEHKDKPDLQNKDLGIGVEVVRAITEKEAELEGTIHNLMSGKARDAENSTSRLSSSGVAVEKYDGGKFVTVCPKSSVVFEEIPSTIGLLEKLIGSPILDRSQNSLQNSSLIGKWAKELIEVNPELASKLENFYKLLADMRKQIDDSIKQKMKGKPCLLNKDIDEIIEKLGWNEEFNKKFSEIEKSLKGETNLKDNGIIVECIPLIKELKDKIDAVKQGKYNKGEKYGHVYPAQGVNYKEIYSALEKKLEKLNKNQYGEFKNQYLFIYHDIVSIDLFDANNIGIKLKEKQSKFKKKFSEIEKSLKGETNLKDNGIIVKCIPLIKELKDKIDAVKQGKYNEGEKYGYLYPVQGVNYKEIYSALEKKLEKLNENKYGEFKNQYLFIYHDIAFFDANNIRIKLKEKQSKFKKKFSSIFVYSESRQKGRLFEFRESEWLWYRVPEDKLMK